MKRLFKFSLLIAAAFILASCSGNGEGDNQYAQRGDELAHRFIIVDGHVDIPYRLRGGWEDISQETEEGDFDYVRAKAGGLDAPFMSIYIPARYQEQGGAKGVADSLINLVERIVSENPDKFAIATSPEEIRQQFEQGLISLPMGMENGAPIGTSLENVEYYYDQGIRYITLTHGTDNQISDSSYDSTGTHGGLSDFGQEVVREMNRVGIMVDVSHISDNAFWDVMEVTEAPVIASHSSARYFTPGFERNMSDSLLRGLGENGGVIMINFGSNFLDSAASNSADRVREEISTYLEDNNIPPSSPEGRDFRETYYNENYRFSNVERVADHIDHVVNLIGIDHVGLGSDYDGVGNTLPEGLKDASQYPNLIAELLRRGYSEEDIEKICSGNVFRVWNTVARKAGELQETGQ